MLMLAIFMIVTMAAIAVYLLTISTGQVQAGIQDEQGARAYQAARAGIEWGAYRLLHDTSCADQDLIYPVGPNDGLKGFRAEVKCTLVGTETEGTTVLNVYLIAVTACNNGVSACTPRSVSPPGSPVYVERQLQLSINR